MSDNRMPSGGDVDPGQQLPDGVLYSRQLGCFLQELRDVRLASDPLKPASLGNRVRVLAGGAWKQADEFADGVFELGRGPRPYPAVLGCLARSLFEGSVRIRWLARDPESRLPLVEAAGARDLTDWGEDDAVAQELSQTPEAVVQRQLARGVCSSLVDGAAGRPPNLRQMAGAIGIEGAYIRLYKSLCWPTHWSLQMLLSHVDNDSVELVPSIVAVAAVHYWMLVTDCAALMDLHEALPPAPQTAMAFVYSRHVPKDATR